MVKKTVATFGVDYYQVLDKDGNADQSLMPRLSDEQLRQMYESMVFIRAFDQKAFTMQRQGRIGTYIQVAGQEASQVGAALAMQPQDMLFPSFRESGMLIARKHPIYRLLMYWNSPLDVAPSAQDGLPACRERSRLPWGCSATARHPRGISTRA